MREAAFDKHTYRHTTIGYEADVRAMPQAYEYSKSFLERFYRPENVVLVIAGDFDTGEDESADPEVLRGLEAGLQDAADRGGTAADRAAGSDREVSRPDAADHRGQLQGAGVEREGQDRRLRWKCSGRLRSAQIPRSTESWCCRSGACSTSVRRSACRAIRIWSACRRWSTSPRTRRR